HPGVPGELCGVRHILVKRDRQPWYALVDARQREQAGVARKLVIGVRANAEGKPDLLSRGRPEQHLDPVGPGLELAGRRRMRDERIDQLSMAAVPIERPGAALQPEGRLELVERRMTSAEET